MPPVLQTSLAFDWTALRPLPGVRPLDMADWLISDDAFAGQMAERERLLRDARDAVLALDPGAMAAAQELLSMVLDHGYPGASSRALRPDGVSVAIDRDQPLATLGRLVQQDFCLMEKRGDQHVLTGAVLCFPAGWMLGEKFLRPLTDIHIPVASYDAQIGRRVQRLFDGLQPGRPLWRFNTLWYAAPDLHQPRSEHDRRPERGQRSAAYLRCERQSLVRLPETRAVAFGIHTFVLAQARVPQDLMHALSLSDPPKAVSP